ncbi:MAG: hypothetical protein ACM3X9_03025 [Bacillota bacterium]
MIGYKNFRGQILFVDSGMGGNNFMTCIKKSNGGVRRFVSKLLPVRSDREHAEDDLRKYAQIAKMRKVELPDDYRTNRNYVGVAK